jgi:N-methylhydantoinase A
MGVLAKDLQMDFSQTRLMRDDARTILADVQALYDALETRARAAFERNGDDPSRILMERTVDARYVGQNHELTVAAPLGPTTAESLQIVKRRFNAAHQDLYGYASADKIMELVTFRLRAWIPMDKLNFTQADVPARQRPLAPTGTRRAYFDDAGGYLDCPIYRRVDLRPGDTLEGPAIVEQMDATTVVPPRFRAMVDRHLNLHLAE